MQPALYVAENLWFLVRRVHSRQMSELIPTVKMETRHHVEGPFVSEFPAICTHCGVMAAGSLKTPKRALK